MTANLPLVSLSKSMAAIAVAIVVLVVDVGSTAHATNSKTNRKPLGLLGQRASDFVRKVVGLFFIGEAAIFYRLTEVAHALYRLCVKVGEVANEFWSLPVAKAEDVMKDEHLAIGVNAGPDPDRWT